MYLVSGRSGSSSGCGADLPKPAGISKASFSVNKNNSASNLPFFFC